MRNRKDLKIDGIKGIVFRKSLKARKLSLFLEASKVLRVTVPRYVSVREAERIINSNTDWVYRYLKRMNKMEREHLRCERKPGITDIKQAGEMIKERLEAFSRMHGYKYNKVTIRRQKTRWGSCSRNNNINLNIKILCLPDELMDYVIMHELVHTEVKNHKKEFWERLEEVMPGARSRDSLLRKYQLNLL